MADERDGRADRRETPENERETEAVGGVVAGRVVEQGEEKGREDKEKGAGGPPY